MLKEMEASLSETRSKEVKSVTGEGEAQWSDYTLSGDVEVGESSDSHSRRKHRTQK
jgi:hypothetical protein